MRCTMSCAPGELGEPTHRAHRASIAREDAMRREATRNNENEQPSRSRAFRVFPQVRALCVFGIITRRSRVQIPPPLLRKPLELPGVFTITGRWGEALEILAF